jgi:hypothetical protein
VNKTVASIATESAGVVVLRRSVLVLTGTPAVSVDSFVLLRSPCFFNWGGGGLEYGRFLLHIFPFIIL